MSAAVAMGALGVGSSLMNSANQSEQIENQAQQQEYAAGQTLLQGRSQASAIRSQESEILGATKAAASGSGVQVGTGSVLDVIEESAFNIELDALTTESNSKRSAANQLETAASTRASKPSALSSLLGAFGSGASGYSSGLQLKG